MSKKLNLFGNSQKAVRFVPVGSPATGIIHLLKRGCIVAKENPVELQEEDRRSARLIVLMREAGKALGKARGIDQDAAMKLLFPQTIDGVQVMASESLEDWLTSSQKEEYYAIAASSGAKKRAATLFIRHRLAYVVEVVKTAHSGASDIEIEPLRFPLAVGDTLKFDSFRAIVSQPAEIGDERVYVNPLPQSLAEGDTGFLIDSSTGREKIGCLDSKAPALSLDHAREFASFLEQRGYPGQEAQTVVRLLLQWLEGQTGWTMSDTDELSEAQINEVYQFYQAELGGIAVEAEKAEGKPQEALPEAATTMPSESSQNLQQSTGSTVGCELKQEDSAILSLNGKTLETAQLS